jgi:hypothetical protein
VRDDLGRGSPHLGIVYSPKLAELLGPARHPDDPEFFGKWADIAHSAQIVYEEIFFHVLDDCRRTGSAQAGAGEAVRARTRWRTARS